MRPSFYGIHHSPLLEGVSDVSRQIHHSDEIKEK